MNFQLVRDLPLLSPPNGDLGSAPNPSQSGNSIEAGKSQGSPKVQSNREVLSQTSISHRKEAVRLVFEKLIADGASEGELKEARKSLAEELEVPLRSFASVAAYVRYSATNAIDRCRLNELIAADQLIEAAHYFRFVPAEEYISELRAWSDNLGIEPELLGSAIDLYIDLLDGRPEGAVSDSTPPTASSHSTLQEREAAPANVPEPLQIDRSIETGPLDESERKQLQSSEFVTGTNVSYDKELKEKWRLTWKDYLSRRLTTQELADATVICLPGITPHLEIRHYLDLGIRPENILAVDFAKGIYGEQFEARAKDLGIQYYRGPLRKALEDPSIASRTFTIANFDFHGMLSLDKEMVLQRLLLREHGILILNFLAKREHEDIKARFCITAPDLPLRLPNEPWHSDSFPKEHNLLKGIERDNQALLDYAAALPIGPLRESGLEVVALHLLSKLRFELVDEFLHPSIKRLGIETVDEFDSFVGHLSTAINELLMPAVVDIKERVEPEAHIGRGAIQQFFRDILLPRPKFSNLEKFGYTSQSGSGTSNYYSAFTEVHTLPNIARKFPKASRFLMSVFQNCVDVFKGDFSLDDFKFSLRDRKMLPLVRMGQLKKAHLFVAHRDGVSSFIRCNDLIKDLEAYSQWRSQFLFDDLISNIPRTKLEL